MKRGDVYWTEFGPPYGNRPAVILTRDAGLGVLNSVTVAPCTTRERRSPTWVRLTEADGMPGDSWVNLDVIQTVVAGALVDFVCSLPQERVAEVGGAARFALQLDTPPEL